MKLKNKLISVSMAAVMLVSVNVSEVSAAKTTKNGFTYNSSIYKAKFSNARDIVTKDNNGTVIGIMSYKIGRLRNKKKVSSSKYEDIIMVKMLMEPQKNAAKKRYGVSEYLKCAISLPSNDVNSWAPVNQAPTDNWTIGLSAGADSKGMSFGVSASTSICNKRLDFESDVRPSKKKANFIYDYQPYKSLSWNKNKNKYFRNSSTQYCMISVNTKNYSKLRFDFNSNFTYSHEPYAQPIHVTFGSSKGAGSYTWKL